MKNTPIPESETSIPATPLPISASDEPDRDTVTTLTLYTASGLSATLQRTARQESRGEGQWESVHPTHALWMNLTVRPSSGRTRSDMISLGDLYGLSERAPVIGVEHDAMPPRDA